MMKIALVTYALNVGGMETFLLGFARHLRREGLEPVFVVTDTIGLWHEIPKAEGFEVHAVLQRTWQSRIMHGRKVADCLKQFDVALLNHSKSAQSSLGLLPESLVAIPVLHNDEEAIYAIGLSNHENIDCAVAVSERVRSQSIVRGIPAERIVCIRNGVEVFHSFPKDFNPFSGDGPLRIVFVGRVENRQKGVFYLPGILARLTTRGITVQLDIVGSGSDLESLKERLSAAETSSLVRFHGALPHEEAMRTMQAADVLLMPSHFEGQPIVIFEAMTRGVVPVVSNLKNITDLVVKDGEEGMLATVGDEEGFADALACLAIDRSRLARMAKAAWHTAQKEYSIETMASKYLNLIEKCLSKRRRGEMPQRTGDLDHSLLGRYPQLPQGVHTGAVRVKNAFRTQKTVPGTT